MDSIAGATDEHRRRSAARTVELLREVEHVLVEMNAELSVAETKTRQDERADWGPGASVSWPRTISRSQKEGIMLTARELADRMFEARRTSWEKTDPKPAIVATEKLSPDDNHVVRQIVEEAGYQGDEAERMAARVTALVIGMVEALSDRLPATAGD